ncbi:MAG: aldolase [Planctomycetes bacterium]|nr:aldolase [Planctomycetota bacterium]
MRKSKVLEKLRAGKIAWTTNVSAGPSPLVCGLAATLGFDGLWIDMEHRDFSYREVSSMIMATREAGADAIVRPRRSGPDGLYRLLEFGAAGLIVPHCMGVEHAKTIVRNTRFAPVGLRGMETVCVDGDYGTAAAKDFLAFANRETFLILQIEDKEAVAEVEGIAALDGVDGIFLGPADLSQSLGIPLEFSHPQMKAATERIAAAARRYGKAFAVTVGSVEAARPYIALGARFVNVSADLILLQNGWKAIREQAQQASRELGL